ncbi:hypothetical protein [Cystobacter fuscus]|uniref:hypothetical protein n=1 Tax=Cystobacter fuscus TaxID=43 RepID=UPI0037C0C82B
MPVQLDVYKERRLVLVGFERAKTGTPSAQHPEIDVRGTISPEFAHISSVMQGDTIKVRMRRYQIDDAAKLYVTSADSSVIKVKTPASGEVPTGNTADVELEGVSGGNPKETKLEVRFGTMDGPIIHQLILRCFTRLTVIITPHIVTIKQTGSMGPGSTSTASVTDIMRIVSEIWRPHGITFRVQPVKNETISLATAGVVNNTPYPGEVLTVLGANSVPNTINVYFVRQLGVAGVLGYGFSRSYVTANSYPNPGIVLADVAAGWVHDTEWAGNDLAHEIGHFFGLWHVDLKNGEANVRQDYLSRRMLMHNYNLEFPMGDWRDDVDYGQNLGRARRGALVTYKDLAAVQADAECTTARATVVSGPY